MGKDHSVDGDIAWSLLLAKGVWRWVPRCDRVHESPEGLEREDITGKGGGQIDIHNLFSQQTLLEHVLTVRHCAGC